MEGKTVEVFPTFVAIALMAALAYSIYTAWRLGKIEKSNEEKFKKFDGLRAEAEATLLRVDALLEEAREHGRRADEFLAKMKAGRATTKASDTATNVLHRIRNVIFEAFGEQVGYAFSVDELGDFLLAVFQSRPEDPSNPYVRFRVRMKKTEDPWVSVCYGQFGLVRQPLTESGIQEVLTKAKPMISQMLGD